MDVYEYASRLGQEEPEEAVKIVEEESGIKHETAQVVMDRTHLDIDPVPGAKQVEVLKGVSPILVESGDVPPSPTWTRPEQHRGRPVREEG